MQRQHLIAGGVALLIAVVSGVWFGGRPSQPVPAIIERGDVRPSVESARITIHVSGAVAHPGLVELDADGRVADALAAAGGALQEAELSAMNLAAPLADGTLIVVPERGSAVAVAGPASDGRVRINNATLDEIATLPGIGPVLAQRIFDHREVNGPFGSVEDLLDVSGIGEGKLADIRESITIP